MFISKESLQREANLTGYRAEIIEKVIVLIQLLNIVGKDSYLKERFVLKGGTALNLFYFDLPRLSVDIDLNYIGKLDREEMLMERPVIEDRLCTAFQQLGLTLYRKPTVHAGGKMVWRYPSCLGGQGNVEVDLNFMYRIPLWPIHFKDSHIIAGQQAQRIPVLDIHELAAGKLSALIDRGAGRDIFDAHQLFKYADIDFKRLRLAFVIYAGMNRKRDLRPFTSADINFDFQDFAHKLIPVIKHDASMKKHELRAWAEMLREESQAGFSRLVPFTDAEILFHTKIIEAGEIEPALICDDEIVMENIRRHPALIWAALQQRV